MGHNLYYLFISGIILGSGPCLSFCAPLLASYSAVFKKGLKNSLFSYLVFSVCKITSYIILALIWAKVINLFSYYLLKEYSNIFYKLLAIFVILIGVTTLFYKKEKPNRFCKVIHRGNIKNIGIMGFLIGFSPCLPLFGILNYIAIVSDNSVSAIIYAAAFGLGTAISPLLLLVVFTAKISEVISKNKTINKIIKITAGIVLIAMGLIIILQTPQQ